MSGKIKRSVSLIWRELILGIIVVALCINAIIDQSVKNTLEDRNQKLENHNTVITSKLTDTKNVKNDEITDLIERCNELEATVEGLNTEMEKLTNENKNLEIAVEDLIEENKKLKDPYTEKFITTGSRLIPGQAEPASQEYCKYMDLRTPANVTAYEIDCYFEGTGMANLGKYYIAAQEQYGVNAVFLFIKDLWESGWGSSDLAIKKNNLSGYEAYDPHPFENGRTFSSKPECIRFVSEMLSKNYLADNGRYHKGYDLYAINEVYAQNGNTEWVDVLSLQMWHFDKFCIELQQKQENNLDIQT